MILIEEAAEVGLSFAGGRMENNETPLKTAERELLEETGYSAKSFKIIHAVYPLPAICDQKVYFILAEGIRALA